MRNKLSREEVAAIRARFARGETQTALATEFGVHKGHVSRIVNGKTWTPGRTVPETLQRIYDRLQ